MFKLLRVFIVSLFCLLILPLKADAQGKAFVTIVNPVRGLEFWDLKDQKPVDAVSGQMQILNNFSIPATWLMRFDSLNDLTLVDVLRKAELSHEKGLLLEITPALAEAAGVTYHQTPSWHFAGSVFLTGYSQGDREKLIDTDFNKFKSIWGYYPVSVGAWWVDGYSLEYMYKKYGISGCLIVADQYTTDNYQIWGQYFGTPYYPNKFNALVPAQNNESKIPVVVSQWAQRDPVNGYGSSVIDSTYSVQANDYIPYHKLDTKYFSKLLDIYLDTKLNPFSQLTVGLENSYRWKDFSDEYRSQAEDISKRVKINGVLALTMKDFASWYKGNFSGVSPRQIVVADDPLGSGQKAVWFMDPYYRVGWFFNRKGSVFQDIRQYGGDKELCYDQACDKLNFATSALRTLDFVTLGQDWLIDRGKIKDFQIKPEADGYVLSYQNEAGKLREIKFLSRDMVINGISYTIDGAILKAQSFQTEQQLHIPEVSLDRVKSQQEAPLGLMTSLLNFLLYLSFAILIPGFLITLKIRAGEPILRFFLSISTGMVSITLLGFVFLYLKAFWLIYIYVGICIVMAARMKAFSLIKLRGFKINYLLLTLVILGTIFQSLSLIKSGWVYDFGMGFWGPLGHDGVWHQALVNQLTKNVPPQNPIFSKTILANYHYFYDLLVAVTYRLSGIPVLDLIYRFYPVLFSILLGVGTYILAEKMFSNRKAGILSVYFVYFGSSFGWIVEYIKEKHFGGESAFWVNQPVSFNLNPPFAISLIFLISLILLIKFLHEKERNVLTTLGFILIAGLIIEFKVYAGIIVLGALFLTSVYRLIRGKDAYLFLVFIATMLLSAVFFLPQNSKSGELLVFSPFWFIHSMIDFPDRVGWLKLSAARMAYFERGDYLKFLVAETLGLIIFIVGNLGTRVIALLLLPKAFRGKMDINSQIFFVGCLGVTSLIIPIFLIQKGNPWNTIQFMYYFLYIVAVVAGYSCQQILRLKPALLFKSVFVLILLITPISSVATFRSGFYSKSPSRLTTGELEALKFLKKQPEGVVLTPPFVKTLRSRLKEPFPLLAYESTSYVSAFSAQQSYVEDELQQEILQNVYEKRIIEAKEFFSGKDLLWSKKFLSDEKIKYLYMPKIYDYGLSVEKVGLERIFNNEETEIFRVRS